MTNEAQGRLDAEVEQRVGIVCRVVKVVRHDLGNFVYPSRELERTIDGGGAGSKEVERYVRQTRLLVGMVEEIRRGMSAVRMDPYPDEAGLTELRDWWSRFHSYGDTVLREGARCRLQAEGSSVLAIRATRLSMGVLALLAALDAQAGGLEEATLRVASEGGRVLLTLEAEPGSNGELLVPALARRAFTEADGGVKAGVVDGRAVFRAWAPEASREGEPAAQA